MKKLISISVVLTLFGVLFFASCAKEDPATPNNPTSTDPRAKFHGNWNISETSTDLGTVPPYVVTISDSSDASHILFAYLYGFSKKTYGTVSGNNFTIPVQLIQGQNVSGSGVLTNANQINMKYLVQSTSTHYDTVTAILTK